MPALSNPSKDFNHMLPVDSHTARHLTCLSAVLRANSVASFRVLGYDVSSSMFFSSMTHTTHAFIPISIPMFFTISPLCSQKVVGWKLHPSIWDLGPTNTAARIAPFKLKIS